MDKKAFEAIGLILLALALRPSIGLGILNDGKCKVLLSPVVDLEKLSRSDPLIKGFLSYVRWVEMEAMLREEAEDAMADEPQTAAVASSFNSPAPFLRIPQPENIDNASFFHDASLDASTSPSGKHVNTEPDIHEAGKESLSANLIAGALVALEQVDPSYVSRKKLSFAQDFTDEDSKAINQILRNYFEAQGLRKMNISPAKILIRALWRRHHKLYPKSKKKEGEEREEGPEEMHETGKFQETIQFYLDQARPGNSSAFHAEGLNLTQETSAGGMGDENTVYDEPFPMDRPQTELKQRSSGYFYDPTIDKATQRKNADLIDQVILRIIGMCKHSDLQKIDMRLLRAKLNALPLPLKEGILHSLELSNILKIIIGKEFESLTDEMQATAMRLIGAISKAFHDYDSKYARLNEEALKELLNALQAPDSSAGKKWTQESFLRSSSQYSTDPEQLSLNQAIQASLKENGFEPEAGMTGADLYLAILKTNDQLFKANDVVTQPNDEKKPKPKRKNRAISADLMNSWTADLIQGALHALHEKDPSYITGSVLQVASMKSNQKPSLTINATLREYANTHGIEESDSITGYFLYDLIRRKFQQANPQHADKLNFIQAVGFFAPQLEIQAQPSASPGTNSSTPQKRSNSHWDNDLIHGALLALHNAKPEYLKYTLLLRASIQAEDAQSIEINRILKDYAIMEGLDEDIGISGSRLLAALKKLHGQIQGDSEEKFDFTKAIQSHIPGFSPTAKRSALPASIHWTSAFVGGALKALYQDNPEYLRYKTLAQAFIHAEDAQSIEINRILKDYAIKEGLDEDVEISGSRLFYALKKLHDQAKGNSKEEFDFIKAVQSHIPGFVAAIKHSARSTSTHWTAAFIGGALRALHQEDPGYLKYKALVRASIHAEDAQSIEINRILKDYAVKENLDENIEISGSRLFAVIKKRHASRTNGPEDFDFQNEVQSYIPDLSLRIQIHPEWTENHIRGALHALHEENPQYIKARSLQNASSQTAEEPDISINAILQAYAKEHGLAEYAGISGHWFYRLIQRKYLETNAGKEGKFVFSKALEFYAPDLKSQKDDAIPKKAEEETEKPRQNPDDGDWTDTHIRGALQALHQLNPDYLTTTHLQKAHAQSSTESSLGINTALRKYAEAHVLEARETVNGVWFYKLIKRTFLQTKPKLDQRPVFAQAMEFYAPEIKRTRQVSAKGKKYAPRKKMIGRNWPDHHIRGALQALFEQDPSYITAQKFQEATSRANTESGIVINGILRTYAKDHGLESNDAVTGLWFYRFMRGKFLETNPKLDERPVFSQAAEFYAPQLRNNSDAVIRQAKNDQDEPLKTRGISGDDWTREHIGKALRALFEADPTYISSNVLNSSTASSDKEPHLTINNTLRNFCREHGLYLSDGINGLWFLKLIKRRFLVEAPQVEEGAFFPQAVEFYAPNLLEQKGRSSKRKSYGENWTALHIGGALQALHDENPDYINARLLKDAFAESQRESGMRINEILRQYAEQHDLAEMQNISGLWFHRILRREFLKANPQENDDFSFSDAVKFYFPQLKRSETTQSSDKPLPSENPIEAQPALARALEGKPKADLSQVQIRQVLQMLMGLNPAYVTATALTRRSVPQNKGEIAINAALNQYFHDHALDWDGPLNGKSFHDWLRARFASDFPGHANAYFKDIVAHYLVTETKPVESASTSKKTKNETEKPREVPDDANWSDAHIRGALEALHAKDAGYIKPHILQKAPAGAVEGPGGSINATLREYAQKHGLGENADISGNWFYSLIKRKYLEAHGGKVGKFAFSRALEFYAPELMSAKNPREFQTIPASTTTPDHIRNALFALYQTDPRYVRATFLQKADSKSKTPDSISINETLRAYAKNSKWNLGDREVSGRLLYIIIRDKFLASSPKNTEFTFAEAVHFYQPEIEIYKTHYWDETSIRGVLHALHGENPSFVEAGALDGAVAGAEDPVSAAINTSIVKYFRDHRIQPSTTPSGSGLYQTLRRKHPNEESFIHILSLYGITLTEYHSKYWTDPTPQKSEKRIRDVLRLLYNADPKFVFSSMYLDKATRTAKDAESQKINGIITDFLKREGFSIKTQVTGRGLCAAIKARHPNLSVFLEIAALYLPEAQAQKDVVDKRKVELEKQWGEKSISLMLHKLKKLNPKYVSGSLLFKASVKAADPDGMAINQTIRSHLESLDAGDIETPSGRRLWNTINESHKELRSFDAKVTYYLNSG